MSIQQAFDKTKFARNLILMVVVSFVLFLCTLIFIFTNNSNNLVEFTRMINASEASSKKMKLFSEFAELARGRTRNTIQILETDDPFEQDELNQELEGYAARFAEVREQLDEMSFKAEDKALYETVFDMVPMILPAQRKAVNLLIYEGDFDLARKLIYETVLPGQQEIIDVFHELIRREQSYISQGSQLINDTMQQVNDRNNVLFGFILVVFLVVTIVIIRRITLIQRNVANAYESLEDIVDERTNDLKMTRDAALMASKSKSEFLSSMSHELRTPLNAIIGFAQLLEMEGLPEMQADSVREIHKSGKHLLSLINEVLDLARIEAGRMSVSLEEVTLDPVLQEVKKMAEPIADRHQVKLSFVQAPGFSLIADPTRLKQVLLNLVSNGIKYNRVNGSVAVFVESYDDCIRISVKDTGKGIAPEQREGLFEPFNRLGAEGSDIEGTGIGMMITQQFVQLMNGKLDFESEVGEGSVFWVELPQVKKEPAKLVEEQIPERNDQVVQSDGVILYIEDNPANMKLMQRIFQQEMDAELITATNGRDGLEMVNSRRPALILLDINMPEMDGFAVLKRLKENTATQNIPVVMLTANAMADTITRAFESGADDYLSKPVDIKKLKETITSALDG